jgi:hypothetical protein
MVAFGKAQDIKRVMDDRLFAGRKAMTDNRARAVKAVG